MTANPMSLTTTIANNTNGFTLTTQVKTILFQYASSINRTLIFSGRTDPSDDNWEAKNTHTHTHILCKEPD